MKGIILCIWKMNKYPSILPSKDLCLLGHLKGTFVSKIQKKLARPGRPYSNILPRSEVTRIMKTLMASRKWTIFFFRRALAKLINILGRTEAAESEFHYARVVQDAEDNGSIGNSNSVYSFQVDANVLVFCYIRSHYKLYKLIEVDRSHFLTYVGELVNAIIEFSSLLNGRALDFYIQDIRFDHLRFSYSLALNPHLRLKDSISRQWSNAEELAESCMNIRVRKFRR